MFICSRKLVCVFLALGLLLQACVPAAVEQPVSEPVKLKVHLATFLSFAPYFIATEEGYFTEQGLQVEFVKVDTAPEHIPLLAKGDLDVWAGGLNVGLLNAIAREGKIQIVADKGYVAPEECTYISSLANLDLVKSGELNSPSQLAGRRIGMIPASIQDYYMSKILGQTGLTTKDIEVINIPNPARLEAIGDGSLDLAVTGEPWVTRILRTGSAEVWMPAEQVIPDFQFGFIVFGPNLLEKNPDAGRRFIVAYLKAVRQYNQGKTERNLEILAKHTGLDRELLTQACWSSFRDDGQINVQSVLDFQAWAVEKGYLDSPVTADQFWDPSFVEYANQVLGTPSQ
jgi:NitT/TauT family transport system substrate-binding protein